jgi:hypothetical protein
MEFRRKQVIAMCLKRKGLTIELINKYILPNVDNIYFTITNCNCNISQNNLNLNNTVLEIGPIKFKRHKELSINLPSKLIFYTKHIIINTSFEYSEYLYEKYKNYVLEDRQILSILIGSSRYYFKKTIAPKKQKYFNMMFTSTEIIGIKNKLEISLCIMPIKNTRMENGEG